MPTIINNRSALETDPLRNFRFLVSFLEHSGKSTTNPVKGSNLFGFTSVSGLAVTTDSIPYREGGYNTTVHQIPGQTTFAPITLQRGVMLNHSENWDRMKKLFQTVQSSGGLKPGENFRFDMEIQVLSHPVPGVGSGSENGNLTSVNVKDHIAMRFHVYNCWPTSVAFSDLNAGDNALLVEQMTLVHEGFDASLATALPAGDAQNDAPIFQ